MQITMTWDDNGLCLDHRCDGTGWNIQERHGEWHLTEIGHMGLMGTDKYDSLEAALKVAKTWT